MYFSDITLGNSRNNLSLRGKELMGERWRVNVDAILNRILIIGKRV